MAKIKPFACVRPNACVAARVAALPYDIFDRKEAYEEATKDPLSFLNIDRPETQFDESVAASDPRVYERARKLLSFRREDGTFLTDEQKCYYLYELVRNGRSQTGIVACASIDDYQNHIIKKHENTREEKENDRIMHVDVCNAQTGPIFLAYRAKSEIKRIVEEEKHIKALYDFISTDQVRHRIFRISDGEKIKQIDSIFEKMDRIYIADGHHRAASAVKVGLKRRLQNPQYTGEEGFNYFLSVLFPDDELTILDYNRVIKDLNGLDAQEFLKHIIYQGFFVEAIGQVPYKPIKRHEVGMYLDGIWYRLTMKKEICPLDRVEGLDVSILQNKLFEPVLGIHDPKKDARIDFVGGVRGLSELKRRADTDMRVAFSLYPTSIEELFAVADAGLLMPPKSTWFEPKLRSGLFIHMLD